MIPLGFAIIILVLLTRDSLGATRVGNRPSRRNVIPKYHFDPDTTKYCNWWLDNDGSWTCQSIESTFELSLIDFSQWNPSIALPCDVLAVNQSFCIAAAAAHWPVPHYEETAKPHFPNSTIAASTSHATVPAFTALTRTSYVNVTIPVTSTVTTPVTVSVTIPSPLTITERTNVSTTVLVTSTVTRPITVNATVPIISTVTQPITFNATIPITSTVTNRVTVPTTSYITTPVTFNNTIQVTKSVTSSVTVSSTVLVPVPATTVITTRLTVSRLVTTTILVPVPATTVITTRITVSRLATTTVRLAPLVATADTVTLTVQRTVVSVSTAGPTLGRNGVPTPVPSQPDMVGNCQTFYFVRRGDTCESIAARHHVAAQQIVAWNPYARADCTMLLAEYYACVGVM